MISRSDQERTRRSSCSISRSSGTSAQSRSVATLPTDLQRARRLLADQHVRRRRQSGAGDDLQSVRGGCGRQPPAASRTTTFRPNMIDPVAKKFLAYFPATQRAGRAGTNYNNYRRNVQYSTSAYQFDARVDHQFNDNNHLGLRYSRLHNISSHVGNIRRGFLYLQDRCPQRGRRLQLDDQPQHSCTPAASAWISPSRRASPAIPT